MRISPGRSCFHGTHRTRALVLLLMLGVGAMPARAQDTFEDVGGAFAAPASYSAGQSPYAVVVGNLDGDGLPELVVGNENSDDIAILQGDGAGGFGPATFLAAGDGAQGVTLADIDGDGDADIVVANLFASTLSIFRNQGNGTFGAAESLGCGANPHAIISTDLDGDTDPDLASANGGAGVSVFLNNGAGSFAAGVGYAAGPNPRDIAAADVDGDGDGDLVVSNEADGTVSVLLNSGSGTFATHQPYPVGPQPQSVSVADIDGDGDIDIAVPSAGSATVALLLGNGTGVFTARTPVQTLASPLSARIHDVDSDGKIDIIVTGFERVAIHRGNGSGGFAGGSSYAATLGARSPWPADVDGDSRVDLVVVGSIANAVAVLRNASQPPLNIAPSAAAHSTSSYERRKTEIWVDRQDAPNFSHAGYADIDRDGDTDWMQTYSNNQDAFPVRILRNEGLGAFTDATAAVIVGPQPDIRVTRKIISGDFNGDGWPDLFVAATGIDTPPFPGEPSRLFLSNGNGTLTAVDRPELQTGFNHCATAADIDANGTTDVLVGRAGSAYLLINDGSANFETSYSRLPSDTSFFTCEFADLDEDGWIDLVVGGHEQDGNVTRVFWGQASGLYRTANSLLVPAISDYGVVLDFVFEDFDGDGARDLIAHRTGSTHFYQGRYIQFLRRAARSLTDETGQRILMNRSLPTFDFLRAQDFDRDNDVDLFVDDRNEVASGEYAWRNANGAFVPYEGPIRLAISPVFVSGFEDR